MKKIMSLDDYKLIDLVEARPAIYDKTDRHYSNNNYCRNLWNEIADELKSTVLNSQKRWRYLRDYFVRQLHSCNADSTSQSAGDSGTGQQFGKKTCWPYYDRLQFLIPFSSKRRNRSSLVAKEEDEDAELFYYAASNFPFPQSDDQEDSAQSISSNNSFSNKDDLSYLELLKQVGSRNESPIVVEEENNNSNSLEESGEIQKIVVDVDQYDYGGSDDEVTDAKPESGIKPGPSATAILNEEFGSASNITNSTRGTTSNSGRKRKRWEMYDELIEMLKSKQAENECDEHEHFFKSLLISVRRIEDRHIMDFRTDVMQIVMKYLYKGNNGRKNVSERERSEDVVVIDTDKKHWRKNLRRYSDRRY